MFGRCWKCRKPHPERSEKSEEWPLGKSIFLTEGNPGGSTEKKHIFPREHPGDRCSATKSSQQSTSNRHKHGSGRQQGLLPPGHRTHNTVNSTARTWSSHRRRYCYKHLHTHSLGNIAVGVFRKLNENSSSVTTTTTTCLQGQPGWLTPARQNGQK